MFDGLSLIDTADSAVVNWYVIYMDRQWDRWWTRHLKPGFQHCFLAKSVPYGPTLRDQMWVVVDPCGPFTHADVVFDPTPLWVTDPKLTYQRVTASRPYKDIREHWAMGPPSCVETVKAFLGIGKFWLRTPWQLYQYIQDRGGVIVSR